MAEVATKKLFENDRVIVWEMLLAPGESTGVHTHTRDYMVHILEGTRMRVFDKEGAQLSEVEFETGSTSWIALDGEETVSDKVRVPATHSATNIGKTRFREILVEFKDGA